LDCIDASGIIPQTHFIDNMAEISSEVPIVHIAGREVRADYISPPPGSLNSAVWCRNVDELIGAITHGVGYTISPDGGHTVASPISKDDALIVADYLVKQGKAEIVPLFDGSVGWNIYHYGPDDDPPSVHKQKIAIEMLQ
jgi:hypothetical protein